jgi:uncharacterized protein
MLSRRRGLTQCSARLGHVSISQTAFVRVVSNPSFSPYAVTLKEAADLLSKNLKEPNHRFWPDSIAYADAARRFEDRLLGHKQVTDAYLLGLALNHRCKLATLDRGLSSLLPGHQAQESIEFI